MPCLPRCLRSPPQELGFRVLEVNPGQDRAGVHILKAIGEATQSRRLADVPLAAAAAGAGPAGTGAAGGGQQGRKARGKAKAAARSAAAARGSKRLLAVVLEDEDAEPELEPAAPAPGGKRGGRKQATAAARLQQAAPAEAAPGPLGSGQELGAGQQARPQEALTLILFDEFDSLLEHDKGFLQALLALVQDSKRPILLVTNAGELRGPLAAAACLQLAFSRPQQRELLAHLALVAAAEGCGVGLPQLRSLVGACGRDTRRCMLALQLWGRAGGGAAEAGAAAAPRGPAVLEQQRQQRQQQGQQGQPWAAQPEQGLLFKDLSAAEAGLAALAAACCGPAAQQQPGGQQAQAQARQQQLQAYADTLADASWLEAAATWVQQQADAAAAKKAAAGAKRRAAMYAILGGAPPAAAAEPRRSACLPSTLEREELAAAQGGGDADGREAQAGRQQEAEAPGVLQPKQQKQPSAGPVDSSSQPGKGKHSKGGGLGPWLGKGSSQAADSMPPSQQQEQAPAQAEAGSQAAAQQPSMPDVSVSPVVETCPAAAAAAAGAGAGAAAGEDAGPDADQSQQAESAAEGDALGASQAAAAASQALPAASNHTPAKQQQEQQQQEQPPMDTLAPPEELGIQPLAALSYIYRPAAAAQDAVAQQLRQLSAALDALSTADLLSAPRDPCPSAAWALPYSQHTAALLQAPLRPGQNTFSVLLGARAQLAAAGAAGALGLLGGGVEGGGGAPPPPGAAGHVRCAVQMVVGGEEGEDGGALLEELQRAECVGLGSGEARAGAAGSHGPLTVPQLAAQSLLAHLQPPLPLPLPAEEEEAGAGGPARLELLQQLDEALVSVCLGASAAGSASALERLAWLARACTCEARREQQHGRQAARLAGRSVRRVGRFEHYMQRLVPGGVAADTIAALLRFGEVFQVRGVQGAVA
jgi:hypothetical protein